MKRIAARMLRFAKSLEGRIALFLAVGMFCAAFGALMVADKARRADIEHVHTYRGVASAVDVINRLQRNRADTEQRLSHGGLIGAHVVAGDAERSYSPDPVLSEMVASRVGKGFRPGLSRVSPAVCMASDPFWQRPRAAGFGTPIQPDCWILSVSLGDERLHIRLDLPRLPTPSSKVASTVFLVLLTLSITVLAVMAAALVTAPLRRLSAASEAFARSIDAEPVAESGPADVRQALSTFNVMQERVREGLRERTRILAAISHDLQTPLTRLRLRLEQVEDAELRERLLTDLSATMGMVKRGLELARSSESGEPWSTVDLDSLLSSMAEDAAEFGHDVRFTEGCRAYVRVKPDALTRCVTNLVDNAVKYAGGAEISCRLEKREAVVHIRDHGPGIAGELMARIFTPFVRGAGGQGPVEGTGIGLTIAKAQAAAIGGSLALENMPDGGVLATIRLPRAR